MLNSPLGGRRGIGFGLGRSWQRGGFLPTDITGLQLWLDFSDASTLFVDAGITPVSTDGDAIYRANDKSGNGNNVIQLNIDRRPLYKTGIKNGLSISRYDGLDDLLQIAQMIQIVGASGEWSVITVQKRTGITGDVQCVITQDTTGTLPTRIAQFIRYDSTTHYLRSIAFNDGDPSLVTWQSVYETNMTDFVVSSAIVSISEIQLHVNGNSATAISITDNLKVNSYYVDIGARYNGSSNYFYGDICEIIAYNSALSDPDRQSVESYLNNKWAIY